MKRAFACLAGLAAALTLTACAIDPPGPTVAAMPSPYKPFDVFSRDDASCRAYASNAVANQAYNANGQAIASTLIGAGLGAALGAAVGNGRTTSIGLAEGAIMGTAVGAAHSSQAQYGIQARYDAAYSQCMYAKGDQVAQAAPPPGYVTPGRWRYYGPAYGYAPPRYVQPTPSYPAPPPSYSAPPPNAAPPPPDTPPPGAP